MRKVIVNNIVSLDGHYSTADGNPLALAMDSAFDRENLASIETAGTVLLGRRSFDGFSAYWPFIADAPEPDNPDASEAREVDDVNRAISRRYNAVPKVVVSSRGSIPRDNAWYGSSTVLDASGVRKWLRDERQRGQGDILIFASRTLWNSLARDGEVDELRLMVSPTVLVDGVPLFDQALPLKLLGARTYDDSDNVQMRYAVGE
ncbi:dihydrofolate reductase family protein [Salinibacterium sp. SYSU T00001]|uniref:dihydrofolate reductase family protein n=1 Tax=Homoserinimonas sedimenticola TaxID=2986805 RepID=UPI002235C96D|nr:dihydrofolate reductase family protein [Salinibacterium sedimenticola]MCW4384606.1 dihydrofolate reductase family protein [Salinibacterium sedimenticola]